MAKLLYLSGLISRSMCPIEWKTLKFCLKSLLGTINYYVYNLCGVKIYEHLCFFSFVTDHWYKLKLFYFSITLKGKMWSNRKICWIYHTLWQAPCGVTFSNVLFRDGNLYSRNRNLKPFHPHFLIGLSLLLKLGA